MCLWAFLVGFLRVLQLPPSTTLFRDSSQLNLDKKHAHEAIELLTFNSALTRVLITDIMKFALLCSSLVLLLSSAGAANYKERQDQHAEHFRKRAKIDRIDVKLGQFYEPKKSITKHYWLQENWLDELQALNKASLQLILSDENYKELIQTFGNKDIGLLEHVKPILCPKNFFIFGKPRINIPSDIQQKLLSLLSMDQICDILIKEINPKTNKLDVLKVINQPKIVNDLGDLVIKEFGYPRVEEILAQVLGLENLAKWIDSKPKNYGELRKKIEERQLLESNIIRHLKKHSFFTRERLLEISSTKDMNSKINEIIVDELKKQLPIEYQYIILSYWKNHLSRFLLSTSPSALLKKEPKTWITFLDHFTQWIIKTGDQSLEKLLVYLIFEFKVADFDYDQIPNTWEQVFNEYLEKARQQFSRFGSIETLKQLQMVAYLEKKFEINEAIVQAVCKVSEFLPEDCIWPNKWNLIIGTRLAMAELIKNWPELNPFLKIALWQEDYMGLFLECLWKSNYCFHDFAAVNLFMDELKQRDLQKGFISNVISEMKLVVNVDDKDFNTAEEFFTWISEARVKLENDGSTTIKSSNSIY